MKNILTIQLTSMMKTKVWRTEEQICCRPDRAKFEPAILLRAGLKICHTTTMTTTTTKTRLTKTTSGGNRENFAPKDYVGCKKGGARGCKNSEKNITDLFLDGDTLKLKAKQKSHCFFPSNRLIAFMMDICFSDGMQQLVFKYWDFIKP